MIANAKIRPVHLERSAYVYVRQSTEHQVQKNIESQQRQYELVELAVRYGWPKERVVLIDDDLGRSGSSATGRTGFARLVADVALSKAGIVFGLEVSRLARNNRDWYQLLDLCSMTTTLIADADGVYDPASFNDRLLLGLKGTMSEAELHVLKGRMLAGMQHKASKGELHFLLPSGLEFDEQGRIIKARDEQVVHMISLVFAKFFEIRTVSGVLKYLLEEGLTLPRRAGIEGTVRWARPFYKAVYGVLTNPLYSGAYVFGRSRTTNVLDADGHVSRRQKNLPIEEWNVVIHDHHPAYISWDDFLRLRLMIAKNAPVPSGQASQVAREGSALLQGLARCGKCGRATRVAYYGSKGASYPKYVCRGAMEYGGTLCQAVGGSRIDDEVAAHFLEEMAPASSAVHLAALSRLRAQHDGVLTQLELELERAQYEADRKARQFDQVEPENRLVARTLEDEWNQALARVEEVRQRVAARREMRTAALTQSEEDEIKRLAYDLPALWQHRATTDRDRKQLVRAVLEEVQIRRDDRDVSLKIVWKGGAVTERNVQLPKVPAWNATPVDVVNLVRELATRHTDQQIARILIRKRIKSAKDGLPFNAQRVANLRNHHGIECYRKSNDRDAPAFTVDEAANILSVGQQTVLLWLKSGLLKGDQLTPGAPWRVYISDEDKQHLNAADAPQGWLPLRQAASRLGVSAQTVANWVKSGKVNYVYVTKGQRRGMRIDVGSATSGAQERLFS
jgi:DNA invertase Pin-like site-specific DNA recombinase